MGDKDKVLVRHSPALDITMAKHLLPNLGDLLGAIKPQRGASRSSMTVPIAPAEPVTDLMLFEAPEDPEHRYHLPRYRLGTVRSGDADEFRVRLERTDQGARLVIVLEAHPAAELADADAEVLPHTVSAILRFDLPGGVRRELDFTEQREVHGGIELRLDLAEPADLSEVYWALTTFDLHTQLVVRRRVEVAVPVQEHREAITRIEPLRLDLQPTVVMPERLTASRLVTAPEVARIRPAKVLRKPIRLPRPGLPRPGLPRPGFPRPGDIVVPPERPDPPQPPEPPEPPEPLYRKTSRTIEDIPAPEPFVFSPELHPNVFGDVTDAGGPGDLILDQVVFDGVHHSYYRSSARPEVVYYLPDSFKLARVPHRPRSPFLSVFFESEDGSVDTTTATVALAASPYVAVDRLEAAATELRTRISGSPTDGPELDLQPAIADSSRLSLRVALPGSAGSAVELPGAVIDLRAGIRAGFELPLTQFQMLFDALHAGGSSSLLTGVVEVRLGHRDRPAETIPFVVRMDDLAGAVLDMEVSPDTRIDGFRALLTNAIESPVRIETVHAVLDGEECAVTGLPDEGTVLDAGDAVELEVLPSHPTLEELPVLDVATVVRPDKEAIWDAICDDTTTFLERTVTVKTPDAMFADPADGSSPVIELVVEIGPPEGGLTSTVTLNSDSTEAAAPVTVPFGDVVLRREDAGTYRYRVTTVRADRVAEGDWQTRSSAVLWIVTGDVA